MSIMNKEVSIERDVRVYIVLFWLVAIWGCGCYEEDGCVGWCFFVGFGCC